MPPKYTSEQTAVMESLYQEHNHTIPILPVRKQIAQQLGKSDQSIYLWFRRRQQKDVKNRVPVTTGEVDDSSSQVPKRSKTKSESEKLTTLPGDVILLQYITEPQPTELVFPNVFVLERETPSTNSTER